MIPEDFTINKDSPLAQGLVGLWPIQDGGGLTVRDYSGYGAHGTMQNMDPATDWVRKQGNLALEFDGVNDRVDVPDYAAFPSGAQATWAFRMEILAQGAGDTTEAFLSKWNHAVSTTFIFELDGQTDQAQFFVANTINDTGNESGTIDNGFDVDGLEHDYVVVFDGTEATAIDRLKVFKDGTFLPFTASSGDFPTTLQNSNVPMEIGDITTLGGRESNIRMRDLRVYNITWREGQINHFSGSDGFDLYEEDAIIGIPVAAAGGATPVRHYYDQLLARAA